jgi:hypothetical protein
MPAEDIANINLGMMLARLESIGGWKLDDVNLKGMKNEHWLKALRLRHQYLENLSEVKVSDLCSDL